MRRWRKACCYFLLLLACAILFPVGFVYWQRRQAFIELQTVLAEVDRTDPGWRLEGLEAARRVVPDERNGALVVLTAHRMRPDSPASGAALRPGDELRRIGATDIHSQGDVLFALHKAPPAGSLALTYRRGAKDLSAILQLVQGWRSTDLTWRQSIIPEVKYLK
jgi:hypothetical protein